MDLCHSVVLQHCIVFFSCCHILGTRFPMPTPARTISPLASPENAGKAAGRECRPQSSGVGCCLCAKPWGEGRRASIKETQTQPICKSMGCTSALRRLHWLPKQAVASGQVRMRCHGRVGCRFSSTSPQSCMVLPECHVNC